MTITSKPSGGKGKQAGSRCAYCGHPASGYACPAHKDLAEQELRLYLTPRGRGIKAH